MDQTVDAREDLSECAECCHANNGSLANNCGNTCCN
jgi:hypothetical protein